MKLYMFISIMFILLLCLCILNYIIYMNKINNITINKKITTEIDTNDLINYSTNIRIGIYYESFGWMIFIYNKLISCFQNLHCLKFAHMTIDGFGCIATTNNIEYTFLKPDDYRMGCVFDKVYYQHTIDDDIVQKIIVPSLTKNNNIYKII